MQGLRTQENQKFKKFFEQVQNEAAKRNSIFFLDCGQGNIFENDFIECEDMCGWLIPKSMAEEFTPLCVSNSNKQHDFDDYYIYVDYKVNDSNMEIKFDVSQALVFKDQIAIDFYKN